MTAATEAVVYRCSCGELANWTVRRLRRASGPRGGFRGMVTAETCAACHEHLRAALELVLAGDERAQLEVRQLVRVRPPATKVTMADDDSPVPTVGEVVEWGEEWALVRWPAADNGAVVSWSSPRREAIDQLAPWPRRRP